MRKAKNNGQPSADKRTPHSDGHASSCFITQICMKTSGQNLSRYKPWKLCLMMLGEHGNRWAKPKKAHSNCTKIHFTLRFRLDTQTIFRVEL